jgi:peptidoglycan hydrolase-like protein with peptidoglycan-binding domain/LysM repeat protein
MSTHTIKSGDTLWSIAARYGTTVDALVKANGIQNPSLIKVNQQLVVPDRFDSSPNSSSWDTYLGNSTAAAPSSGGTVPKPPVNTSHQSPNYNSRNGTTIDSIIIHHTASDNCSGTISWVKNPSAQASSHYVIDKDGTIHQMVGDEKRAWHAGQAEIPGSPGDVNSRSLGIEIVNAGDGKTPFTDAQYASLSQLTAHLQQEYNIPQQNILGHKDVAPGRKTDPAENFDWNRLWEGMGVEGSRPSTPTTPPPATTNPTLKNGSSGAAVTQMQQALKNAGFDPGAVDGQFGPNTERALKAFQSANGLVADGICGPLTWAKLGTSATKPATPPPTTPPPATIPPATNCPTLKNGSSGAAVTQMQQLLKNAGFSPGTIDGQFGPNTAAALKKFQAAKGLEADGICGPKTWAALSTANAASIASSNPVLKNGSSGAAVTQMQQILKSAGFDPGAIDGQFGPNTAAALKKFQAANGLAADGICGPQTWKALSKHGSIIIPAGTNVPGGGGGAGTRQVTQTVHGKTTTVNLAKISGGKELRTDAAAAYNRMAADAAAAGVNLYVTSAFRTNAEQAALYRDKPNLAAKPGHSNHEGGLSVDISVANNQKALNWLRANAGKYGFREDVKNEPWHWTYYG